MNNLNTFFTESSFIFWPCTIFICILAAIISLFFILEIIIPEINNFITPDKTIGERIKSLKIAYKDSLIVIFTISIAGFIIYDWKFGLTIFKILVFYCTLTFSLPICAAIIKQKMNSNRN